MAAGSNATHYFNFGNSNDVNLIVTSESASIREGAESSVADTSTASGSTSVTTNSGLMNYVQSSQYCLQYFELVDSPKEVINFLMESRVDLSKNSLFDIEDNYPGHVTNCPGVCVNESDPSNAAFCIAAWTRESIREYTQTLFTHLGNPNIYGYATGDLSGDVTALIADVLATDGSFVTDGIANSLISDMNNTTANNFRLPSKYVAGTGYNYARAAMDPSSRLIKDLAVLSWCFAKSKFGLQFSGPGYNNPGSEVIAGLSKQVIADDAVCASGNFIRRQTKVWDLTDDMKLNEIVNIVNASPPDVSNGSWQLVLTQKGLNQTKNLVSLIMCSPTEPNAYKMADGEYFAGCSETNKVSGMQTLFKGKSTVTPLV